MFPNNNSQSINSPEACRRRLFKYVVPVVLLAILINIPKFFESQVVDFPVSVEYASSEASASASAAAASMASDATTMAVSSVSPSATFKPIPIVTNPEGVEEAGITFVSAKEMEEIKVRQPSLTSLL